MCSSQNISATMSDQSYKKALRGKAKRYNDCVGGPYESLSQARAQQSYRYHLTTKKKTEASVCENIESLRQHGRCTTCKKHILFYFCKFVSKWFVLEDDTDRHSKDCKAKNDKNNDEAVETSKIEVKDFDTNLDAYLPVQYNEIPDIINSRTIVEDLKFYFVTTRRIDWTTSKMDSLKRWVRRQRSKSLRLKCASIDVDLDATVGRSFKRKRDIEAFDEIKKSKCLPLDFSKPNEVKLFKSTLCSAQVQPQIGGVLPGFSLNNAQSLNLHNPLMSSPSSDMIKQVQLAANNYGLQSALMMMNNPVGFNPITNHMAKPFFVNSAPANCLFGNW